MSLTKVTYSMIVGAAANVLDYGADATGSTDSTTAIQAAINSGRRYVAIPNGVYNVTALTLPDGVCLVGDSPYNSVIRSTSTTSTVITTGVSNELHNLRLTSTVTRTTGFLVNVQGNGFLAENCEFREYFIGVSVGTIGDPVIVNARILNCVFSTTNTALGSGAVQYLNFSNAHVATCVVTGTDLSSTQPSFGLRFQNGDTAFVSDCNVTAHGKALLVDTPALLNCYALSINNSIFDSAHQIAGGVAVPSAEIGAAGNVFNTRITNCWFGLSSTKSGCVLNTTGSGLVDGITFTGCEFTDNGENGLLADGANVKNWVVTGGHSGGNAVAGIRCASGTNYFVITGHRAGSVAGRGPNNWGITLDAAAEDNFTIADNNLLGNTTDALVDASTSINGNIYNNAGYNGYLPPAAVVVGASPWSYQAGSASQQIYIAGGTVSQVEISAQIVANTGPCILTLAPNEVLTVTYSVAPTVLRKIM